MGLLKIWRNGVWNEIIKEEEEEEEEEEIGGKGFQVLILLKLLMKILSTS
jgi:hypothetical protein